VKNKIEEKISKFIKETEVSNLVAPELNIDSERDAWLRKMGKKEGRGMQAAGYMEGANDTVNCPNCQGTGKRDNKKCWICQGSGKLTHLAWEKHYGNPATMKEGTLPTIELRGRKWEIDGKKQELRVVGKPWVVWKFDDLDDASFSKVQKLTKETYNPVEDPNNYMKKKKYGFSPEDITENSLVGKEVGFETYNGTKFVGERGKIIKQLFNGKYIIKMKNGKTVEREPEEIYESEVPKKKCRYCGKLRPSYLLASHERECSKNPKKVKQYGNISPHDLLHQPKVEK